MHQFTVFCMFPLVLYMYSVLLNTHWNLHSMSIRTSHEDQTAGHLTHDISDMNDEDLPSLCRYSLTLTMYIIYTAGHM